MTRVLAADAVVVGGLFVALWVVSVALRDASIVDIAWGPGFAICAWTAYVAGGERSAWHVLVPVLVSVWGLRLGIYLARRNIGAGEDARYRAMRDKRGDAFVWLSLPLVFGTQAALLWIVSLPVQVAQTARGAPALLAPLVVAGIAVWAVGLTFEAVGDAQLARFKNDPSNRGGVLDRGLWRYTRHPNYFGDFCVWWGLFLLAAPPRGAWWTAAGPLVMSVLLLRVSGVPLLERSIAGRRPGYAEYVRTTSAFIPRPPRR